MRFLFLLFLTYTVCTLSAQQTYTLSGTIADSTNGETIIGAIVYAQSLSKGTTANVYGFYSLTLPEGTYDITFSFISYQSFVKRITLNKNVSLDLKFKPESTALKEIVVSAEASKEKEEVRSTQMGLISIPIEQIKHIPCIGGEVDIIKVMQLMPGIKRGGEGQTGMYVRGGNGDQNLILVDEATVYNVSHLFGFFSVFNNDALKDVMIYKGGFPASYGGRLSAVMDIRMKEGDMQKYHVDGGVGLLSSHITVQGPIIKDTSSFIVSARRSYIDQVFKLAYKGKNILPYYFYDVNAKVNYKLSNRDRIYLSSYMGDDVLAFKQKSDSSLLDFGFYLGNITGTLRWNHLFKNDKIFSNVSLIYTRFRYDVHGDFASNSVLIKSSIQDIGAKADFNYYRASDNKFAYGGSIVNHSFRPNVVSTAGEISEALASQKGGLLSTQEMAVYGLNDRALNARWNINYGGRISFVNANGTGYGGLEPRLSATRVLTETQSLKFGISRMIQYMHLVSSSSIALPTDLWYPVTKKVKPQSAIQLAVGYTKFFEKRKLMFTTEVYVKSMNNLVEYREGANLILNNNFESEIVSGKGAASGIEFLLNRTVGRINGWIGYTLSISTRKFEDLNKGKEYYAKYDRRHDWSFVVNYELSKRWSVSGVWIYSTGLRFTPVVGNYFMPNAALTGADLFPVYTDRNAVQLPASHRLDINFVLKSKEHKHWKSELHLGAYNFYNRAQPYQIRIAGDGNGYKYQAVGLFGFIPSIAFNFSF